MNPTPGDVALGNEIDNATMKLTDEELQAFLGYMNWLIDNGLDLPGSYNQFIKPTTDDALGVAAEDSAVGKEAGIVTDGMSTQPAGILGSGKRSKTADARVGTEKTGPVCFNCQKQLNGMDIVKVGERVLCKACAKLEKAGMAFCADCGDPYPEAAMTPDGNGGFLCENCQEEMDDDLVKGVSTFTFRADIVKTDNEQHLMTAVVYAVGHNPETREIYVDKIDTQGDVMSAAEVEKMAHKWLMKSRRYDLQHREDLPEGSVVPVESYIAPQDLTINEKPVSKGSWVVVSYIPDDKLWALVKSGRINAYSVKGKGIRRKLTTVNY